MDLKHYPSELTDGRESLECSFIFALYRQPELFGDYLKLNEGTDESIRTEDGKFYFALGKSMYNQGYKTLDNVSMYTFLENKPTIKERFETLGGYRTVDELKGLVDPENIDAYYDALMKSNFLMHLFDKGFNVIDNLARFRSMTCQQVYDWYDFTLNNINLGGIEHIKAVDLSSGYDEWIEEVDKGTSVGYKINAPILNYMLAGVHRGCLMLHIAGIGQGKTTTAIQLYVSGAIESGENVLIISNEQGVSEFRSMLMAYVLFNKIKGVKGMNRQKLVIGRFTDEQKEKLKEAAAWISAQPGKISFVEMQDYEITNIKKAVKKYSKLGYGLILVDTIKPLNEAEQGAWAQFSEVSKSLFLLAKQTDTAIICTAQASAESLGRKYLDLSCIAKSRAIAETASQVVGFRPVTNDEVNKIKPYTFKRNPDGSNSKIKTLVDLDPDEHYIVLFVMKNRFGSIFPQIVYRFNQTFCQLEEIGYYDQPYDGGNAKK